MGTHPIFESDFDCLTDLEMNWEAIPDGMTFQEMLTAAADQVRDECIKEVERNRAAEELEKLKNKFGEQFERPFGLEEYEIELERLAVGEKMITLEFWWKDDLEISMDGWTLKFKGAYHYQDGTPRHHTDGDAFFHKLWIGRIASDIAVGRFKATAE